MCNTAKPIRGQKNHLRLPGIRIKRPAMAEDNRLTQTPIFIVNLCTVTCGEIAHFDSILCGY